MALDINEILRHDVYLHRLATTHINKKLYPSLDELQKALRAYVLTIDEIKNISELNKITKTINEMISENAGWNSFTKEMQEMALYEAGFQSGLLSNAFAANITLPVGAKIMGHIKNSILSVSAGQRVDAGVWEQFISANKAAQATQINGIIRSSYAQGRSMHAISKEIKKSFDGVIKREAETLARTGFAHYAAQANEAVILSNKDILNEYYYVITFDSRTSNICINADLRWNKRRFKVGTKAPMPPLHYNCRTRRMAVTKGWEPQGEKTSVGGVDSNEAEENFSKRKEKKEGNTVKYSGRKDEAFKPSMIKASTGYDTWLKTQPKWFVVETLGKARADLFLSGKIKLSKFTDITGRTLTLKELKAKKQ